MWVLTAVFLRNLDIQILFSLNILSLKNKQKMQKKLVAKRVSVI
jgi:hypothetical protein